MRKRIAIALLCTSLCAGTVRAQAPNDFDGDGQSDILITSASGTTLRWVSTPSAGSGTKVDTTFGASTDLPIPGYWQSAAAPSLAVIGTDPKKRHLLWQTLLGNGEVAEARLGAPGDYVFAGADFDGDGIADGATMTVKGTRFRWSIQKGILSGSPSKTRSFTFGSLGDRVLFVNPNGEQDWAATFGLTGNHKRAQLVLRNTQTGAHRRFTRFPRALAIGERPRPLPVKREDGSDVLVFVTNEGENTRIKSYDLSGALISKAKIAGKGATIVGDFDLDQPGEEVFVQTTSTAKIYNPLSGSVAEAASVSGTLVDSIEVTSTASFAPTPTPTPAATETPDPTE